MAMNRRKFLGASAAGVVAAPMAANAAMASKQIPESPFPAPRPRLHEMSLRGEERSLIDQCRDALARRHRDKYDGAPDLAVEANLQALRSVSAASGVWIRRARFARTKQGLIRELMADLKSGAVDDNAHRWFWFLDS